MTLEVFIIFFLLLAISSTVLCKCAIIMDLPDEVGWVRNLQENLELQGETHTSTKDPQLRGRIRANLIGIEGEHELHETYHSVTFYFMKKDCKRCCDTTTPGSIHTKDESKRDSAFAFIFGVN